MAGQTGQDIGAGGLKRAGRLVAILPSWLSAATLFALMVMTFADVVLRSAFNAPLAAGTELTKIFMAIIVFTALPLVTWRGEGIVVDLLDPLFSNAAARIRDILVDLVSGILLFWPAFRIWDFVWRAYNYGDTTEYLHIPQFYVVFLVAVSVFATAIVLIVRAVVGLLRPHLLRV
ncbi:MAG: TRAP transporter small permease [Rhizobiaceae bacterium]